MQKKKNQKRRSNVLQYFFESIYLNIFISLAPAPALVASKEAGEFKKLKAGYRANEEAFREGALQFGTPIIGGTSNQMENESDDYMKMYTNADKYNNSDWRITFCGKRLNTSLPCQQGWHVVLL